MSDHEGHYPDPPQGPGDHHNPGQASSWFPPPSPSEPPAVAYPPPGSEPNFGQAGQGGFAAPAPSPYGLEPPPAQAPSPAAYPPPKKRRVWPWLLLGVPILFGLVFVGCIALVIGVTRGPIDATNTYVAHIDNGEFGLAYDTLCPNVQSSFDRDVWAAETEALLGGEITDFSYNSVQVSGSTATVTGTIDIDGVTLGSEFDLVEVNDEWRVCSANALGTG